MFLFECCADRSHAHFLSGAQTLGYSKSQKGIKHTVLSIQLVSLSGAFNPNRVHCFVFGGLLTFEKSVEASLEFHRGAVRIRYMQRSHERH